MIRPARHIYGYDIPLDQVFSELQSSDNGLSQEDVTKKLQSIGKNEIPKIKGSIWQVYFAPLFDTLITVYLIMTAVLLFLSMYLIIVAKDFSNVTQAAQWLVVVAINFIIAIVQQNKAQKKMDALQKLSTASVKVVREGKELEIDVTEIVPGDIIELNTGASIPADCRIIKSVNLLVNEASLTGESVPATKTEDGSEILKLDTPIGERHNMIFRGCFIQTGNVRAVVVNTGLRTEIGKISDDLAKLNTGEIPLRTKVNQLGKYLSIAMISFLTILTAYTLWQILPDPNWNALELVQRFINNIVTAMSIMPINIPLLTTIVLLTGVLAMAQHKVVIRNLSGVESLGRISVLASDKTGTITKSQMTVKRIWDGEHLYAVTGLGYGPSGVIFPIKNEDDIHEENALSEMFIQKDSSLELLLTSGFLNNNASILIEEVPNSTERMSWKAAGSPTDAAILALFSKSGLNRDEISQNYVVLREYPFDSAVKRMSKIVKSSDDKHYLFCKGATEVLLDRLTNIGTLTSQKSLDETRKREIKEMVDYYAGQGYRVIMLTFKQLSGLPEKSTNEREQMEKDLTFIGIVCVLDPPREGVKEAVGEAISAGITPIMITGDSPVTAGTIARNVGLLQTHQEVHEGNEIKYLTDDNFFNTSVFARVSPQHKQIIVERYQKVNKVVAMTGDGVNDALALSMSDAGISMGITGTDVAKQASDIVITDDSYVSIVKGVRQGRGLFQKIRIMIMFYIGVNLAEALVYIGTSFIPNFYLLDTWQRIYIFSIVHSIPPLAIIFDQFPRDIMNRTPIDTAGIFNKQLFYAMLCFSLVLSVMLYVVYFGTLNSTIPFDAGINNISQLPNVKFSIPNDSSTNFLWPTDPFQMKARTMMVTVIYIAEPLFVLSIRRIDKNIIKSIKEDGHWFVYLMVFSMPVFHLIMMYIPSIQNALTGLAGIRFDVMPLSLTDWLIAIVAGLLPIISLEVAKAYARSKKVFF